jgi:uncharacterized protein with HEPN domain
MSYEQKRLEDCLAHIIEAIERIENYVSDMDELTFLHNKLVQDAVIRNFEFLERQVTVLRSGTLNLLPSIQSCPWHLHIKCATL